MIPKKAKKVFEGILFDVYHWPQKLFDGSTVTYEAVRLLGGAQCVFAQNDKIMVLKQEQALRKPYYGLPGGKREKGESLKQTAARELLEETGYKGTLQLLTTFKGTSKVNIDEEIYVVKNATKIQEPHFDPGEKIKVEWMSFDDFLQLARDPETAISFALKHMMYEALLDEKQKTKLYNAIFV